MVGKRGECEDGGVWWIIGRGLGRRLFGLRLVHRLGRRVGGVGSGDWQGRGRCGLE